MKHTTLVSSVMAGMLALGLGACSASGSAGHASPSVSQAAAPPAASQVASSNGVTGTSSQSPALYEREEITGQLNGADVQVITFNNAIAKSDWLNAALTFGGRVIKQGPLWVIYSA